MCPGCNNLNYARRTRCNRCSFEKTAADMLQGGGNTAQLQALQQAQLQQLMLQTQMASMPQDQLLLYQLQQAQAAPQYQQSLYLAQPQQATQQQSQQSQLASPDMDKLELEAMASYQGGWETFLALERSFENNGQK
eukprot:TRINITY_DN5729_c0_g2_i1.p2 TRINITY_DN5729_c0_g2~~TRINITY_DN5729_c0_g2_i1.p2  ORF type:complete len:136 (+),score=41.88 TRINITY_DN5729_c0_g2_i1:359-766(+)